MADLLFISHQVGLPHQIGQPCGKHLLHASRREHAPWRCPQPGWCKLNVDGSSFGNPGKGGAGGLIRDEGGNWVVGFSAYIGFKTAFKAELYAIKHGLGLLLNYTEGTKVEGVIIESDCLRAVEMIDGRKDHPGYSSKIAEDREFK
ncbi:hypothetical protein CRG98_049856, partial [Punica granatum]